MVGKKEGEGSPAAARVLPRLARVCTLDDAVLSDEDEDDDELQWLMASLTVVVATSIRWRRCAKARLKLSVTMDFECAKEREGVQGHL
jgi:hypothetical protein